MGFLDNLEDNLKTLESREEAGQSEREERLQRAADWARAAAAGPWAEKLRHSSYTADLLNQVTRIGHARRKVHLAWLGNTLRLEARQSKLELRPTPQGILAAFLENNIEVASRQLDLDSAPALLAEEWFGA